MDTEPKRHTGLEKNSDPAPPEENSDPAPPEENSDPAPPEQTPEPKCRCRTIGVIARIIWVAAEALRLYGEAKANGYL